MQIEAQPMEWINGLAWGVVGGLVVGCLFGYWRALRDHRSAISYYHDDAVRRYAGQMGLTIKGAPEPPPL
jgi:hypothetical protein